MKCFTNQHINKCSIHKMALFRNKSNCFATEARIYLKGVLITFHFVLFWGWGVRLQESLNGVNRLATKGKKYYRLPTKREKNYRQLTEKLLTDYRHGPTLYFFSERRVYCIFSTFLGSNQRYHATNRFTSIPQNEDTEIGLQSVG